MRRYHGITYPPLLDREWIRRLWRRFCCTREWHLLDEVGHGEPAYHYLVCDACDLMVYIDCIDLRYTTQQEAVLDGE